MKLWMLIVAQVWALSYTPVWGFMLIFAPLLLTNNPAWPAFILTVSPPFIALACSAVMWVARGKRNVAWQKAMLIVLVVLPPLSVAIPFGVLK